MYSWKVFPPTSCWLSQSACGHSPQWTSSPAFPHGWEYRHPHHGWSFLQGHLLHSSLKNSLPQQRLGISCSDIFSVSTDSLRILCQTGTFQALESWRDVWLPETLHPGVRFCPVWSIPTTHGFLLPLDCHLSWPCWGISWVAYVKLLVVYYIQSMVTTGTSGVVSVAICKCIYCTVCGLAGYTHHLNFPLLFQSGFFWPLKLIMATPFKHGPSETGGWHLSHTVCYCMLVLCN